MITIAALLSCVKKVAAMGSEKKVMRVMKAMKVEQKTMKAMKAWKEKKNKKKKMKKKKKKKQDEEMKKRKGLNSVFACTKKKNSAIDVIDKGRRMCTGSIQKMCQGRQGYSNEVPEGFRKRLGTE